MKAIRTTYLGPTNTKGSRVRADDGDGYAITLSWDSARDADGNHDLAARALAEKMGWLRDGMRLVGGGYGKHNYYVFVRASI